MRPRILDLFCKEGGAGTGFHRAGFDVVGVDIEPQPRYPFEFVQANALEVLRTLLAGESLDGIMGWLLLDFDAIHASPPCQFGSKTQRIQGNEHPNLIGPIRDLIQQTRVPYTIENVPESREWLIDPFELCGTMFGLPLYRHRLFECNFPVTVPLHGQHWLRQVKMGRSPAPDEILQPVGNFAGVERARRDMDMPWASRDGLREAIPPAYTALIGGFLMSELRARSVA